MLRPQELHEAVGRPRPEQTSQTWQGKCTNRAGAESTIHQAVTTAGMCRARYRGLPKVTLQHTFAATAINLVRLREWWTAPPLGRVRKPSHLTRLGHALAG
jgi:IS5 family transposase